MEGFSGFLREGSNQSGVPEHQQGKPGEGEQGRHPRTQPQRARHSLGKSALSVTLGPVDADCDEPDPRRGNRNLSGVLARNLGAGLAGMEANGFTRFPFLPRLDPDLYVLPNLSRPRVFDPYFHKEVTRTRRERRGENAHEPRTHRLVVQADPLTDE